MTPEDTDSREASSTTETRDRIAILVLDQQVQIRQALLTVLKKIPQADLVGETAELDGGIRLVEETTPDMVFLNLHPTVARALALAEDISRLFPTLPMVVAGEGGDSDLVIQAMRAGADEFLTLPIKPDELYQAIRRLQKRSALEMRELKRGKTICCFGIKGGVGVTTVATNLAASIMHRSDKTAAIVDLSLQAGEVATFLDLQYEYTITDVIKNFKRLDRDFLKGAMARHASGISLLPAPRHVEDTDSMDPDQIGSILLTLRSMYDFILIDTMKTFNEINLAAFDFADMVLLITEMNIPSLRATRQALDVVERLGYSQEKVKLIVNRYQETKDFSLDEVTRSLTYPIFWKIPNDFATVNRAINLGQPLPFSAPKSPTAKSFSDLADTLVGSGGTEEKKKQGRFRKLFSR